MLLAGEGSLETAGVQDQPAADLMLPINVQFIVAMLAYGLNERVETRAVFGTPHRLEGPLTAQARLQGQDRTMTAMGVRLSTDWAVCASTRYPLPRALGSPIASDRWGQHRANHQRRLCFVLQCRGDLVSRPGTDRRGNSICDCFAGSALELWEEVKV